jgi:hypothetical protein
MEDALARLRGTLLSGECVGSATSMSGQWASTAD